MKHRNWRDLLYLKDGNDKQKRAYKTLEKTDIMLILKDYRPVLVGTIPIEIDIESSDLDIVCEVEDFIGFEKILRDKFSDFKNFRISYEKEDVIVCNFWTDGFEIEIYASKTKIEDSNAYRHMLIEFKLLSIYGDEFRKDIIALKQSGFKTEPSFAYILGLKGNPYEELLVLEDLSDEELSRLYIH